MTRAKSTVLANTSVRGANRRREGAESPDLRGHELARNYLPDAGTTVPLISVVITAYNHGCFLRDAIESVLEQTIRDYEVVVVDDGSTDDTPEVASAYSGICYVRQENQGLSAARNTGMASSRGRYIVFLDADDRLLPGALAAGLSCFAAHPDSAFICGRHRRIAKNGEILGLPTSAPPRPPYYHAFLRGNFVGMHGAVMYRRDRLQEIGGFDPSLKACEDYNVYLRMARQYPMAVHDGVVADYRIHGANMSSNISLMLSTALRVLRAERDHVRHDVRRRAAFEEGVRNWRRYYGQKMLPALGALRSNPGAPARVAAAAWNLLCVDPTTFVVHGSRRITNHLGRTLKQRLNGVAKRRDGLLRARPLPNSPRDRPRSSARKAPSVPVGAVRFGDFRRLAPVSRTFGYDRGCPIDRYYIDSFLARHASAIQHRVLEVGDDEYTHRFGRDHVTHSDVLHVKPGNPKATFVDDLASGESLPSDAFDCIILTQTLHLIYDVRAALATLNRILRPGGVLLMTVPGTISQLEKGTWADVWHWGFTELSMRKLCAEAFDTQHVELFTYGNVLSSVAFLEGLASEELDPAELDFHDPLYPLVISVRIRKPALPEDTAGASNI